MNAYVITPNGDVTEVHPANGTDFKLKEMYRLVGCDCVEFVRLHDDRWMVVDEDGIRNGRLHNPKATELYKEGRMSRAETKALAEQKYSAMGFAVFSIGGDEDHGIVGNALVCLKSMIK